MFVKHLFKIVLGLVFFNNQSMSQPKSNIAFIIFKAHSEENEPLDPYENILKNEGYEAYLVPTLEFEYHNFDELKHKLQNPQDYSG